MAGIKIIKPLIWRSMVWETCQKEFTGVVTDTVTLPYYSACGMVNQWSELSEGAVAEINEHVGVGKWPNHFPFRLPRFISKTTTHRC